MISITATKLPFKILAAVFQHLEKPDLTQCLVSCKNWYKAAEETLYESIHLESSKRDHPLLETIYFNRYKGTLVKKAVINSKNYTRPEEQVILLELLNLCPSITSIDSTDSEGNRKIWHIIFSAIQQNSLQKLKYMPLRDHFDPPETYLQAALALKQTLTTLSVRDYGTEQLFPKRVDRRPFEHIASRLNEFMHLKRLYIGCCVKAQESMHEFDFLIDSCPRLLAVTFALHQVPTSTVFIHSSEINEQLSRIMNMQKIDRPRHDIKFLCLTGCFLSNNESVSYVMRKFCNLLYLKIQDVEVKEEHPIPLKPYSIKLLQQFIQHMMKIHSVNLETQSPRVQDIPRICGAITEALGNKQSVQMELSFSVHHLNPDYIFKFSKRNALSNIAVSFAPDIFKNGNFCPHQQMTKEAGHKLQTLTIRNFKMWQQSLVALLRDFRGVNATWLEQVLVNCPSLQTLSLYSPGCIHFADFQGNYSLKSLLISDMDIDDHRLKIMNTTVSYDEHFRTSSVDFWPHLSRRLPLLEHLKLHNVFMGRESKYNTMIDMPITSLQSFTWSADTSTRPFNYNNGIFFKIDRTSTNYMLNNCHAFYLVIRRNGLHKSNIHDYCQAFVEANTLCVELRCQNIRQIQIYIRDHQSGQKTAYSLDMAAVVDR